MPNLGEAAPIPKNDLEESPNVEKAKYAAALEIIQERDSEQLDVDQLHQKILERTDRISNFNPNWCHTTSEGSSGGKKLSSDAHMRSRNNITDTPKSMKNAIFENKKLFFESFKNNFSIDYKKKPKPVTSVGETGFSGRIDSANLLQSKREMQVIVETQDNETRDFSRDKMALLHKFQERLQESEKAQTNRQHPGRTWTRSRAK